jgi:hypothetical protein
LTKQKWSDEMKKLSLMILMLFISIAANAEEYTQTVRGQVIDKETKMPLIGAKVVVSSCQPVKGAYSNQNGEFTIKNVPVGRQTIRVSYVGYAPRELSNLIVASAKELVLEIEMVEQISETEEITVTASGKVNTVNESAIVSARSFSVEETQRFAGAVQDPARLAANFAGVVSANDERNDIVIRGNSPTGLLWMLEDINIPNPNHFASTGTTGGGISILNNNNLANSDFMTGAFPSEYGNALSGVFDLKLRKGNNSQGEYMAQVGVMGVEAGAEGPFLTEGSSFLANYRYSTMSLVDKMGAAMDDLPGIPVYQDMVFDINLPNNGSLGNFRLFGLGGQSEMNVKFKEDEDIEYDDLYRKNSHDDHLMGVLGLSNQLYLSDKSFLKTTIAYTGSENNIELDTLLENGTMLIQNGQTSLQTIHVHIKNFHKFDARNNLMIGFYSKTSSYDYLDSNFDYSLGRYRTQLDMSGSSTLLQGYANWQHKLSDDLLFNLGANYQHFTFNGTGSIEPRFAMQWRINNQQSLSFGSGLHSQIQPFGYYIYETELDDGSYKQINNDLKMTKSAHFVLSYDYNFSSDMRLKAETYYQHIYNVPIESLNSTFSMLNVGADFTLPFKDNLTNDGSGKNYGIELTMEKFFSDGYYFLVTGSIFESKYKASDGVERNTAFNSNFAFSALGGVEFKVVESSTLIFDAKLTWTGGKRYIPIDLAASSEAGYTVFDYDQAYNQRYKDYLRLDAKVGYRFNTFGTSHYIYLDVRNVLNTKNIFQYLYNPHSQSITTMYQLTMLPNLYYKIEF